MIEISMQEKTTPLPAKIGTHWFENENIGLLRTLFHRIEIPLAPFNTGQDYIDQPEKTSVYIDWINLSLDDPSALGNLKISHSTHPEMEASVYIGAAHNPIEVLNLGIVSNESDLLLELDLHVDFEDEGVGMNETFKLRTTAAYIGESW